MTIIAITLTVLLVAILALATVAVRSRNETITALKGEVIVRTLAVREARRQRDRAEQMLDDTEQACGVAREVIRRLDDTPIYRAVAQEQEQREATVLEFRRAVEHWDGAS